MNTVEILKQAKRVIKSVKGEKLKGWDMRSWGVPEDSAPCGTVRCALGHIASDPWFTRRGLRLVNACPAQRPEARADPSKIQVQPFYRGRYLVDAFATMSGITCFQASRLFTKHMSDKPRDTIKRLDELIKSYR